MELKDDEVLSVLISRIEDLQERVEQLEIDKARMAAYEFNKLKELHDEENF